MNTADLEQSIILIGNETPTDLLLSVGDKIAALGEFLRDIKSQWEAKMIERIEQSGPIMAGDIRYYVGQKKTTKCQDVPGTVEAILDAVEGDFVCFCEHLGSGAIKYGAAKQTLKDDVYAKLFVTAEESELKEGKPAKQLQKVNERFIR